MKRRCVGFFVLIISLMIFPVSAAARQERTTPKDESLRSGETRATLDPNLFQNPRVKKAYQVAKQIPWVLDSIYCYCIAKSPFNIRAS